MKFLPKKEVNSVRPILLPFDYNSTCRRVRWGKHGSYETITTPAPLKVPEILFNDRALGSDLLQPKGD